MARTSDARTAGGAAGRASRRRKNPLRFLALYLLLAVAAVQVPLAKLWVLTPWRGGGFGMFSTLDSSSFRPVRVYAVGDGWERRLKLPEDLSGPAYAAGCLPTDGRLEGLARRVAARLRPGKRTVRAVRVEVWKTAFDPATTTLSVRPWRSVRYELDHGAP